MAVTASVVDIMNKAHTIINIVLSFILLVCFFIVEDKANTARDDAEYAAEYYALATEYFAYADAKYEALDIVHQISEETNIAPELILAMVKVESNFQNDCVSSEGCSGLMQISPIHNVADVFDVETNLTWGVGYVQRLLDDSDNIYQALGKYNMGVTGYEHFVASTGQEKTPYVEKVMQYCSDLQP